MYFFLSYVYRSSFSAANAPIHTSAIFEGQFTELVMCLQNRPDNCVILYARELTKAEFNALYLTDIPAISVADSHTEEDI